jgi:hypothetical protein
LQSNVAVSSDLTLAGQTAPGDGITLYGRSTSFSGQHNVIVRYLRFREGIAGDKGKCSVNLSTGSDMIFDHCSIEWGRWDCLGLTVGSHDMTFQNCIIGEGVDPQRFGSLSDSVTNITYARNLWINNQSRNPKAKGRIQYINNVVYNWAYADWSADIPGRIIFWTPSAIILSRDRIPVRIALANSPPPTMFSRRTTWSKWAKTERSRAALSSPRISAKARMPRPSCPLSPSRPKSK